MTDLDIFTTILDLLKEDKEIALATIVSKIGPSPAGLSSKMIIKKEDFDTIGTVGGGCLEAEIVSNARDVFLTGKPRIVKYRLDDDDPLNWLICGGTVEILIEPVSKDTDEIINASVSILEKFSEGILCTIFSEESTRKFLLSKNEWIGKGPDEEISSKIESHYSDVIKSEKSTTIKPFIFLDPLLTIPKLFIFGGGHISRHLAQFSKAAGFHTTVIDDRIKFANKERFSYIDDVICEDFEEVFKKIRIDKNSYVVIVTRGHKHDKLVLDHALQTNAFYIGMIGSKKKVITILKRLHETGYKEDNLRKVFSPIGLELGAKTPEEIAISIVSEMIKIRRKGKDGAVKHLKNCQEFRIN